MIGSDEGIVGREHAVDGTVELEMPGRHERHGSGNDRNHKQWKARGDQAVGNPLAESGHELAIPCGKGGPAFTADALGNSVYCMQPANPAESGGGPSLWLLQGSTIRASRRTLPNNAWGTLALGSSFVEDLPERGK